MGFLNAFRYAFLAIFCLILLPGSGESYTIGVKPGTDECFYADLKQYDLMLLSYDVLEGGDQLIDFRLYNPLNVQLQDTPGRKDAYYSYNASNPGLHKYCFHNQLTEKKVSFNLNVVKHKVEEKKQTSEQIEFEAELEKMEEFINQIESQLSFAIYRDESHKTVSTSFDSKLKWWTIIQGFIVIGACFWQVTYLKSFFEVRRVV